MRGCSHDTGSPHVLVVLLSAALFAAAPAAQGELVARGSVEQVQVTGAEAGRDGSRCTRQGPQGARRSAPGTLGGIVFRDVKPGRYRVRRPRASAVLSRAPLGAAERRKIYDQKLPESGYGYLTTRDGTKLAINVHLPASRPGPVPDAGRVLRLRLRQPGRRRELDRPDRDLLGYAVVDVNMRGTGCSGGAFDYFEPLQGLDGYDVDRDRRAPAVGRCTTRSG